MYRTFSICALMFAAGCSNSGKPADGPSDAKPTTTSSAAVPTSTAVPTSGVTEENPPRDCGGKTCAAGETCVSYYGIAGPRGPQFHDCVIPCKRGTPNDGCPEGKRCSTIADGPGDVCQ